MNWTQHAEIRARQRGIPPLIEEWLVEFGEEDYDGQGARRMYFSKKSIRNMEREFGRAPVRKLSEWFNVYKVEALENGSIITIGHRYQRLWRR